MEYLDDVELAENPEPRSACVLLLDTSYSMTGDSIDQLNEGLRIYEEDIKKDPLASQRVETAVVSFGGTVDVVQDFTIAGAFTAPHLDASGDTPMGEAIARGLAMIEDRKRTYKDAKLNYFRPWLFLVTDGAPTDEWKAAVSRLEAAEEAGSVVFFAVGVDGADFELLTRISKKRPPVRLLKTRFQEMFRWLSQSQKRVSSSRPDEQAQLPSTSEWAEVPT